MTNHKTFRPLFRVLYVGALALPVFVSACATADFGPNPMPTGYKYQNEEYKTPSGNEPADFSELGNRNRAADVEALAPQEAAMVEPAVSVDMNAVQGAPVAPVTVKASVGGWMEAARDLIGRMTRDLGTPTELVYLEPAAGVAHPGFEAALRMAMGEQGWKTVTGKGAGGFKLIYNIGSADGADAARRMLAVRLVSGNHPVIEESGFYALAGAPAPAASPVAADTGPVTIIPLN